ncbi:MAG: 4'-phosphopantetheinyl transferase superfamily protein, partial [Terracidiphilus sp.]
RFEAALRNNLGMANAGTQQAVTFGDVCRILGIEGDSASVPETAGTNVAPDVSTVAANSVGAPAGILVGIDVEPIAALPEASDYWEHEFYKSTFSPREIAYALLQPSPRETFAGAWCAKEALRKVWPGLAQAEWTALEVIHDVSGKPAMTVDGKPAGGALSISHTGDIAVAVFVAGEPVQLPPVKEVPQTAPVPQIISKSGRGGFIFALIALLLSAAALYFSLFHR